MRPGSPVLLRDRPKRQNTNEKIDPSDLPVPPGQADGPDYTMIYDARKHRRQRREWKDQVMSESLAVRKEMSKTNDEILTACMDDPSLWIVDLQQR